MNFTQALHVASSTKLLKSLWYHISALLSLCVDVCVDVVRRMLLDRCENNRSLHIDSNSFLLGKWHKGNKNPSLIQLQFKTNRHFTNSFFVPIKLFAATPDIWNCAQQTCLCVRCFWRVLGAFVVNCNLMSNKNSTFFWTENLCCKCTVSAVSKVLLRYGRPIYIWMQSPC